jgi:dipeptidyl aminopeptidase/acylaminoacyl peptidase
MRSALLCLLWAAICNAESGYRKPAQEILDVLHAPATPLAGVNPTRTHMFLAERVLYPPIAEVAAPMLRLAGVRIDPASNGPHRRPYYTGLTIKRIADGRDTRIAVPPGSRLSAPDWSADGKRFAVTNATSRGTELWIGAVDSAALRRIDKVELNAVLGDPVRWMPDSNSLLVTLVPARRGNAPEKRQAPPGPNIQESVGKAGPMRTWQDMLTSPADEAAFDYYAASQVALVDAASGAVTPLGAAALYTSLQVSPDGKYILLTRIKRPYSYLNPYFQFPRDVEVWDRAGRLAHRLASLPLEDRVPIEGVPTGPRQVQWHPVEPASLAWIEALDEGDPRKKAAQRDRILTLKAPFQAAPTELLRTEHRFAGLSWTPKAGLALVTDYDRARRWVRTLLVNMDSPTRDARTLFSRNIAERYKHPGTPVTRTLPSGHRVLHQSGDHIFLVGEGATPEGARPFLDRLNLRTLETTRLFRCEPGVYESVEALLSDDGAEFLTSRESPTEPPNYFVRSSAGVRAMTRFPDTTPQLRKIKKQLVAYKRPDDVNLSFTLYLPPGHQPGQRLPTVMWAYPLEYTDPDVAGQVSGSPYRFSRFLGPSHLFFLLAGYAILDNASLPVVGDPETVNNTYLDQIVAGAKAAIDKATEMGVTDPKRVGVGGHSYGGFMTANLLAHSDLFRAGIARSGAYNRTLTPFGFQSERRTFWEASDVYVRMSPFFHAHKINEPVLLIHGEADDNQGTFPIQSDRMYQAIRGNGGIARLVFLPHEAHGYAARESIEHVLAEQLSWFDRYVKNATQVKETN